jgi:hypothetical protein
LLQIKGFITNKAPQLLKISLTEFRQFAYDRRKNHKQLELKAVQAHIKNSI